MMNRLNFFFFQAWHIFRLCLFCHVTQIAATMAPASDDMDMDQPSCSSSTFATSESWQSYLQLLGRPDVTLTTEKWVTEQCLPFFRSSAILFHFITNIPYPKLDDAYDNYAEAVLWLRYLGVESLGQLVSESWARPLLSLWNMSLVQPTATTSDVAVVEAAAAKPRPPWTFPVISSGLIQLPSDYSELINAASLFTCPNSEGDEARTPAMCLVTGKMLCSQVRKSQLIRPLFIEFCFVCFRATVARRNWMGSKWEPVRLTLNCAD